METTRLSTKGQIVLPLSIRKLRSWKAGTEFTVEETPQGILLKPAATPIPKLTPEEFDEAMREIRERAKKRRSTPVTLEEMDAGIAAAIMERHARGRY